MPAACAAALAAAFNTPIAAVLFTLEEIMGDLHAEVLGSVVLSSATSWMVLHLVLGDEPLFHVAGYRLVHPVEFGVYAVLGVVGGLGSVCFVKLLLGIRARFMRLPKWTVWFQPAVGGLAVGLMGYFVPEVLGVGYDHVEKVLNGDIVLKLVVLLAVLKIVATAVCYATGNAGGIFGPSLFIGAMMGAAVGGVAHALFPAYTAGPGAYALVGMGTAFAGIVRTPMTSVIMIFEMTRDYTIIVPLMISNMIAYFISLKLQKEPIYEALAHQDGVHLPTAHSRAEAERIQVRQAMRPAPAVLSPDLRIATALHQVEDGGFDAWPVAGAEGLWGMVRTSELERAAAGGASNKKIAEILGYRPPTGHPTAEEFPHVHPDHSLSLALQRMGASGLNVLPVVSRANLRQLMGIVALSDVLDAYGVAKTGRRSGAERVMATPSPARSFLGTMSLVFLAIAAIFAADMFLAKMERAESHVEAARLFDRGGIRCCAERTRKPIERIKDAISIERGNRDYLRTLAQAQLAAGKTADAESTLTELLQSDSTDGLASLIMGRVLVKEGRFAEAISYFHRAIYGRWNEDAAANQLRARFELIDLLAQRNSKEELLAELLPIQDQAPRDLKTRTRLGRLFLLAGSPTRAAVVFRGILRDFAANADAYAGPRRGGIRAKQLSHGAAEFPDCAAVGAG